MSSAQMSEIHAAGTRISTSAVQAKAYANMEESRMKVRRKQQCPPQNACNTCSMKQESPGFAGRFQALLAGAGQPSDPNGIRTHVAAVKGRCPGPLDDGANCGGTFN